MLIIDLKLQNDLVFAIPECVGDEVPRRFFSRGARVVQRDKLLPFLIDNQAACRRDMGKERCHSLTTREAVAGFRTLPDKALGSDSKFVTKPTLSKGNGGREDIGVLGIDRILGMPRFGRRAASSLWTQSYPFFLFELGVKGEQYSTGGQLERALVGFEEGVVERGVGFEAKSRLGSRF